ncbi:MAG: ABC transporter [Candidatus Nitrospira kreftii]|uniref:ABC transporter n=1 Tax=Candidatus Nitrospira kreftii TaxID=2652173 RepID=A0A7S8FCX8_9BACT|nr:MAG: ABC transporter [Candidatus Nitrospira kreftii]
MSDIAIRVEGLSKQYKIGGGRKKDDGTLRDHLMAGVKSLWRGNRQSQVVRNGGEASSEPGVASDTFWALQDVSFEVKPGETVGIIGRNGAGKSTLLKMISRITEPTRGRIELYGRVASLLEVGTGFHSELTGRENVYLNGTILGMKRGEITRKFDEIVAFAEVERFIDTPVKRYSSGMNLRLAFAVAAHLEPDVLIIDEVLAVGDAAFQKKCLGKMEGVAEEGRTIFFVSHNMPAVTRLCKRVLCLDQGKLCGDGPSHEVVKAYLHSELGTMAQREWPDPRRAPSGGIARLRAVRVCTEDGETTEKIDIRKPVGIEMQYEVLKFGNKMHATVTLYNEEGVRLFDSIELDPTWRGRIRPPGRYQSTVWIPGNYLAEGTMFVNVNVDTHDPEVEQFYVRQAVAFVVIDSLDGDSARGDYAGALPGVVRPLLTWNTKFCAEDTIMDGEKASAT